ncbi:MAG: tetratricopeptide repeat protein [Magnetococcales bacterium]|nr:tetratricopeptide repeat protein [Magnetococcales bacterium]NGZ07532.1 tetratricopeptide repeat protein [Magnetococcales bacterium]
MNHDTPKIQTLLQQALAAYQRRDAVQVTACIRQVLAMDPDNADGYYLLGLNAALLERPEMARTLLDKAIARNPRQPYYHFNLSSVLSDLNQPELAEQSLLTAMALKPDLAEAHINLANLRMHRGELQLARDGYQHGLQLDPNQIVGHYNLGVIFQESGDHQAALTQFDRALQLDLTYAPAHMGRAASLLKTGRFMEGWPEYEWRFRLPNMAPRICPVPRWDGSAPVGQRLYLYTEQGFGDAMMFVRFAPLVRALGATVLLECRPELLTLFAASDLADQVTARARDDQQPPPFAYDLHLPLMSLPAVLGITLDNLPASTPYFTPPAARVAAWAARLGPKKGLRVALSWSGNPATPGHRDRSCTLHDLLPITTLPGITFYSIQKGIPATQLTAELQQRHAIIPLETDLTDFTETAAALLHMDLLISTDTAVVHLAGGLNRPVWTLLHHANEWRWLEAHHETSPWYPSMRLFRQTTPGNWNSVITPVRTLLATLPAHPL